MLNYEKLTQYFRVATQIRFPLDPRNPYFLFYFPENGLSFLEAYSNMGIRFVDARHIIIPKTRVPFTRMTPAFRTLYMKKRLIPFESTMKFPENKNLFYDMSIFFETVDKLYKPTHYRQRAGFLIRNLMFNALNSVGQNYRKILLYVVDTRHPINTYVNRKMFPFIKDMKDQNILFDDLVLCLYDGERMRYRRLIVKKEYNFPRIWTLLRNIKITPVEDEEEENIKTVADDVVKKMEDSENKPEIVEPEKDLKKTEKPGEEKPKPVLKPVFSSPQHKAKVLSSIKDFLKKDSKSLERASGNIDAYDAARLAVASVLFKTSGDLNRAIMTANKVSNNKLYRAVKAVTNAFADNLLEKKPSVSHSNNLIVKSADVAKIVENKTPEHIFEKRKIDFEINLKKDMINAFRILEGKELPFKFENFTIEDTAQTSGEIDKSDLATITIVLIDQFGKRHRVRFQIPKIDPTTGIFRVYGRKKCLINQLIVNPISFPKPFQSKFESSYSIFYIYSKQTRKKWLEIFMGSFKVPLFILLAFSFGMDETLKSYGIQYEISKKKPTDTEYFAKVPASYMVFKNVDTELKKQLVQSFLQAKVSRYKTEAEFGTKQYFSELIIKITGRINSVYHMGLSVENIVDPICKQVLLNQQLPNHLPDIIKYMSEKVITGYKEERNDLSNQRIRNSEILVYLTQKLILAAYTEYKEQVLSGNKNAKLNFPEKKVLSQFNQVELVQDMEYANPAEEMATITKITPLGKTVGGIPDQRAVGMEVRNVHRSYFGNIDVNDTPEGGKVGTIQQLSVDAFITSARGMFRNKEVSDKEGSGILSTSGALLPFTGNNDNARVLFFCNHAKQMLPLKNPEPPLVQTGYESLLTNVLSDSFIKRAPCNGKIAKIDRTMIGIICSNGKKHAIDISPVHLHSGSGKNSLSTFRPTVRLGEVVKASQIIAEGACISGGTISLGRNIAVTYMPYEGYNFEDGIVISERVARENLITSLHGIEEEIIVKPKDKVLYIVGFGYVEKGKPLVKKTMGDLEEILSGGMEMDSSYEIENDQAIKKSPGGTIVDIEVFCNENPSRYPLLIKLIEATNRKYKKPPEEKWIQRGEVIEGTIIKFKIEQELVTGVGDKLAVRGGNKGIITLVEKDEMMPKTPWGEQVDLILNPIGILGRMNMGQLFELYCGLISRMLARHVIKTAKSKADIIKIIGPVLSILDSTKKKEISGRIISGIRSMSDAQAKVLMQQIKTAEGIPIIVPPFKNPAYKEIYQALKYMKLQPAYNLTLPRYGGIKTHYGVPFGYIYVSKLEHIGEMKLHARATGPTTSKTLQPTAGKRRDGGQKMGEGDTWALIGYNAPYTLAECFGPLSDDVKSKNEIIADVIQKGYADYREPQASPTKNLLNSYFTALLLQEI